MSIAIIRAPEPPQVGLRVRHGIPKEVMSRLIERASMAGKVITLRTCLSEADVADSLRAANDGPSEFVIFDPGECAYHNERVRTLLNALEMPYIEAHDDDFGALEPTLASDYGPRLTLIQGYGAQSYTVALAIALEQLGCAECENNYHTGT